MNPATLILLLASCAFVADAANAMEIVKTRPRSDPTDNQFPRVATASGGLYTMTTGIFSNETDGWEVNIQKRNSDGFYKQVAQLRPVTETLSVSTNGKWFAVASLPKDEEDSEAVVEVFQLVNDEIVSKSVLDEYEQRTTIVKILSDDSMILIPKHGNMTTYQYNNGQWSVVAYFELRNLVITPFQFVHITDTTLAYVAVDYDNDTEYVCLYTRQADKSWQLHSSFEVDGFYDVEWNGDDAVLLTSEGEIIHLFEKKGDSWNLTKSYSASDLNVKSVFLGFGLHVVDKDTFIISAATFDGAAFVLTRKAGSWSIPIRLEASETGFYGASVESNEIDILILGRSKDSYRFHTLPRCFNDTIDVTCKDNQINSCESLSSVDLMTLYTVNNPLCGEVDVAVKNLVVDSTSAEYSLEFTRFSRSFSCDAKVTCSSASLVLVNCVLSLLMVVFLI